MCEIFRIPLVPFLHTFSSVCRESSVQHRISTCSGQQTTRASDMNLMTYTSLPSPPLLVISPAVVVSQVVHEFTDEAPLRLVCAPIVKAVLVLA